MSVGDELTLDHDIINVSGEVIIKKGQKVKVSEIWKDETRWSNIFNMWKEPQIYGVKIENHYGLMTLSCFEETKNLK